jgi:predicted O-methyltransferase YrrM
VLEFGGGASTIWFLRQGCAVVCFENKRLWHELIEDAAANRDIVTEEQAAHLDKRSWQDDVPDQLLQQFGADSFDVVLVDDLLRKECLHQSLPLVRPGGVLMMDNAGMHNVFPDWDWTVAVQGAPDRFNCAHPNWHRGWTTAWWQRPAPLEEAVYYDVFSEHSR